MIANDNLPAIGKLDAHSGSNGLYDDSYDRDKSPNFTSLLLLLLDIILFTSLTMQSVGPLSARCFLSSSSNECKTFLAS